MDAVRLSPRWAAAGVTAAEARVGYEASGASLGYRYEEKADGISLDIETPAAEVDLFLLLPAGASVSSASGPDGSLPFTETDVGESRYLSASVSINKSTSLSIRFA